LPLVQSITETVLFAHARTAFWYGLQQLPMEKGQKILLPEYICEVVLHPLEDLGIRPIYYPVDDHFVPDWEVIEEIQTRENVHAFLLVHYFGQPQDIERARIFCDRNKLWLIEDNSHGHGGSLEGQQLGSYGDMGFSSPRKQLKSASGGVLYLHGKLLNPRKEEIPAYPASNNKEKLLQIIRHFPRLKAGLRGLLKAEPDFSDPASFPEIRTGYFKADTVSARRIQSENWPNHAELRRVTWGSCSDFISGKGLRAVWDKPHPDSCPWVMPVYGVSKEDRLRWLHWGWKNGLDIFPWPTLPKQILNSSSISTNRWNYLMCFPLHKKALNIYNNHAKLF